MPVKLTGKDYKAFLNTEWGPDAIWEDYVLLVDGVIVNYDEAYDFNENTIDDTSKVELRGGYIVLDQTKVPHTQIDAETFLRKWLKAQTHVSILVQVDRKQLDAFKVHVKTFKGAVLI